MAEISDKTLGKYRFITQVGQGGMARVYKAYQSGLDRHVAVKVLHAHLADEGNLISRFEREASAVAHLRHPNIVQVYDFDVQDSTYYMVMEFIEGPTLKAEIEARRRQGSGAFQLEEVARICSALAQALDYAHSHGVIHRDLKPANIMFDLEGRVVLTDFGIAYLLGATHHTETGSISGTPDYMAPEQARGQTVDARSDLYSLGVILYELLTGRTPFQGDSPVAVILQQINAPVPDPHELNPALPPEIGPVLLRVLEKDPEARYQTGGALSQALWDALGLDSANAPQSESPIAIHATLTQTTDILSAPTTGLTLARPYRGLFAFQEADAPFFFGRELLTERIFTVLQDKQRAAIVGPSGSGKSSLVYAGLLPRLRATGPWAVIAFRPGSRPFHALAAALVPLLEGTHSETDQLIETQKLADALATGQVPLSAVLTRIHARAHAQAQAQNALADAPRLLVLADQFEELYTLCADPAVRADFPTCLLAGLNDANNAGDAAYALVTTLRADFMSQVLTHREFADALQSASVMVGPMTPQELGRAIEKPAARLGVSFETGLTERILGDVRTEPGNLPLLEFALTLLWDRRSGRRMTHAAYDLIGRVAGALARYADEVYTELRPAEKTLARRLFIQLVRPGEGTEDTRRVALRTELDPEAWTLAQHLAEARLVVTGRDSDDHETVEVVHEALIRSWEPLRTWMSADRTFRAWQERLRATLHQWETSGHDDSALLRGALLGEAEGWLSERYTHLSPTERTFIETSIALRQRELDEHEAQRQRELDAARKLAETETRRAADQALAAAQLQRRAVYLTVALVCAVLLAGASGILGWKVQESAQALGASAATAQAASTQAVAQSRQLATAVVDADTQRQEAETQRTEADTQRAEAERQRLIALARQFAAQATTLLDDQLDLATLLSLESVRLSASASGIPDGLAEARSSVYNALETRPEQVTFLHSALDIVQNTTFSPDGRTIATAGNGGRIVLWDLERRQPRDLPFTGHDPAQLVNCLAFTPDGRILISSSDDGTVRFWDAATGLALGDPLSAHGGRFVQTIALSPDGRLLATGGGDTRARIWDVATRREVLALDGHQQAVWALAFSPDGSVLVTGDGAGTVRRWDMRTGTLLGEPLQVQGQNTSVFTLAISPDGKWLATARNGYQLQLWDLATGEPVGKPLDLHAAWIYKLLFTPDSQTLISISGDRRIAFWDVTTRTLRHAPFYGRSNQQTSAGLAPDGQTLAVGDTSGALTVWNLAPDPWYRHTLAALHGENGLAPYVSAVAFMPAADGSPLALSSGYDGALRFWSGPEFIQDGQALTLTTPLTGTISGLAFGHNASFLVSASTNGSFALWNTLSNTLTLARAASGPGALRIGLIPDGDETGQGTLLLGVQSGELQGRRFDTEARAYNGHAGAVTQLVVSPVPGPAGRWVATAGADGQIIVWRGLEALPATVEHYVLTATPLSGTLPLAFRPDGAWLATGDAQGEIHLWDVATQTPVTLTLEPAGSALSALTFNADGTLLIGVRGDGVLVVWTLATQTVARVGLDRWPQALTTLAFAPAGDALAAGTAEGAVQVWDLPAGTPRGAAFGGGRARVTQIVFTPVDTPADARLLALGRADNTVDLWPLDADAPTAALAHATTLPVPITAMAVYTPAHILATGGGNGALQFWDAFTRQPLGGQLFEQSASIQSMRFSPDGRWLATGSCGASRGKLYCSTAEILLWDVQTRQVRQRFSGLASQAADLDFSPDSTQLAAAGCGTADVAGTCLTGQVLIWDVTSGALTATLGGHSGTTWQVAFSADGQRLVTGGGDTTLRIWDVATHEPVGQILRGQTNTPQALALRADGLIASASCGIFAAGRCAQGEIVLWDLATGQRLGSRLLGHDSTVSALRFSDDGTQLISGSQNGQVVIWDLDFAHWQAQACILANRNLTSEEWALYFGTESYRATCGAAP